MIDLPNIKKLFIPDVNYTICDSDLAQADAQVVAWEADDDILKEIFRDPNLDLHDENAKALFGKLTPKNRKKAKAGVHATNYGTSARTLAKATGVTVKEAEYFIRRWFQIHPGIKEWHRRVESDLMTKRCVTNRFGFRRFYFDRIEGLLPEALAWIPQSTVAIVIDSGLVNLYNNVPDVEPLLQVHDSLVYQVPTRLLHSLKPKIKECLEIAIPYDDPLVIPAGLETSTVSWGDVKEESWY